MVTFLKFNFLFLYLIFSSLFTFSIHAFVLFLLFFSCFFSSILVSLLLLFIFIFYHFIYLYLYFSSLFSLLLFIFYLLVYLYLQVSLSFTWTKNTKTCNSSSHHIEGKSPLCSTKGEKNSHCPLSSISRYCRLDFYFIFKLL